MNVDDGIRALLARGFRFQVVQDDDSDLAVLVGSYGWPCCYDRLHIWAENEAIAARVVPSARCGDDVVWSCQDSAVAAIQALLELPDPDEPGAPHLVRRAPSSLWLPPFAMRV